MPLDLRRFQSAIRSKRVVGDQDACSGAVVRYRRLGEAWVLLTSSVAISWRISMTSRAAFRRASADVCSAAGIVTNDTVTVLFYAKQLAEINLCLLTAVLASQCLEVATRNPTRAALSRDWKVLGNRPSRFGIGELFSSTSVLSHNHRYDARRLVFRSSTTELHNGGLRACCIQSST